VRSRSQARLGAISRRPFIRPNTGHRGGGIDPRFARMADYPLTGQESKRYHVRQDLTTGSPVNFRMRREKIQIYRSSRIRLPTVATRFGTCLIAGTAPAFRVAEDYRLML